MIGFVLCAIVIFFAGKKLSYYGDLIAEISGVGKALIGMILMASVTSLPELMVGVSSAAIVGDADLAVGDIVGSCSFNLVILAMMDMFMPRHKSLFNVASVSHILAIGLSMILMVLVAYGLTIDTGWLLFGRVGIISLVLVAGYIISMKLVYSYEQRKAGLEPTPEVAHESISLKKAIGMYALYAVITIVAALFLPHFAEEIAASTGLGKSFVGTLFLAVSTSLPEIAVSLASIRMGAFDMAVGNLVGSNLFNLLILSLDDLFYSGAPLLEVASNGHLTSILGTIMMGAIAIVGLIYKPTGKKILMGWDAFAIIGIYIVYLVILYKGG